MSGKDITKIISVIELQLGRLHITPEDRLVEDLGAESADVANIVAAVEEKFQITIRESEFAKISTPLDILALVHKKLDAS